MSCYADNVTICRICMQRLWLVVIPLMSCVIIGSGCKPADVSHPIVLQASKAVILIDPNTPFVAPYSAVVMRRGRYQNLVEAEMWAVSRGYAGD